jgi:hypothetical protein
MSTYLYGIIESESEKKFGAIGFNGEVTAAPYQNLAVVFGPAPYHNFENLDKETLVKMLLSHQKTLEIIMGNQFILPCKFGTLLKDNQEANEVIAQNQALFNEWLSKMKNNFELEVYATWDVKSALNEIANSDAEIIERKEFLLSISEEEEQEKRKISLGMLLAVKLKQQAAKYSEVILKELKKASISYAAHDLINDSMAFNASFLLMRGGEDFFYKSLNDLDKYFEGRLNFKCVGPLPPYSFATVIIKRFDQEKINRAFETLGLAEIPAHVDQVKHVYKNLALKIHPDIRQRINKREFEDIHQAYKLLIDYYEGNCRPLKTSIFKMNGEQS